jgi:hypothetical protein
MTGRSLTRLGVVAVWMAVLAAPSSAQQISYTVAFDDPNQSFADLYQPIIQHVQAAGGSWNNYLRPSSSVTLEVRVGFSTTIPRATGRSVVSSFVRTQGGLDLQEQGAGREIRTGADPNQAAPDIELLFNPDYLRNELWFDPNPVLRTATVPSDRTDAMSVMLHELGHAFAFNGWRDGVTGNLPGNFQSTFDQHVTKSGDILVFNGPSAKWVYGGEYVPLTLGNYAHIGNRIANQGETQLPGSDLIPDLMNGVAYLRGSRYDISLLDVAIVSDSEVPTVPVPEPLLGLSVAAVGLAALTIRRSRSRAATAPDGC